MLSSTNCAGATSNCGVQFIASNRLHLSLLVCFLSGPDGNEWVAEGRPVTDIIGAEQRKSSK